MSEAVMETLCTRCVHLTVCKWVDEYVDLQNRLNGEDLNKTPFHIKLVCVCSYHNNDSQYPLGTDRHA